MYRYISTYKIVLFNLIASALFFIWNSLSFTTALNIICCLANLCFLGISLQNLPTFVKRNHGRLFIGRKRTLIVGISTGFFVIHALALWSNFILNRIIIFDLVWSCISVTIRMFENDVSAYLHKVFKRGKRVAVVGDNDTSKQLAEKFKRKGKDYFYGQINIEENFTGSSQSLSPYIDFAKKNRINEFYLSVAVNNKNEINNLVEEAEKHCIRLNFVAPQTLQDTGYRVHYVSGMPVLKKYREPLTRLRNQTVKRAFDVVISGFIILFVLSWLCPLIGLIIKLESRGPVFFRQERSGRDNNAFVCLKFRSMRINAHSDLKQATKNDKRITRFGAFLRKTSLDEFPQFINVFKGDMSIIGPRPHMLRHTEEYNALVNHYMVRLYLKPGVTGWAQANGYRGEITDILLIKKRVEHDIWYMENWSLLLDIKIMYLTFMNILKGEINAY